MNLELISAIGWAVCSAVWVGTAVLRAQHGIPGALDAGLLALFSFFLAIGRVEVAALIDANNRGAR